MRAAVMACLVAKSNLGPQRAIIPGVSIGPPGRGGLGPLSLILFSNKRTHVKVVIIIDLQPL